MIDDYKAGLCRRRHSTVAKTLKTIFNGSLSRTVDMDGRGRVRLMIEKVAPRAFASSRHVRDPYDRRFLDVVVYAAESKRWKDRKILFATGDRNLRKDAERALVPRKDERIHIAPDMGTFKELFSC